MNVFSTYQIEWGLNGTFLMGRRGVSETVGDDAVFEKFELSSQTVGIDEQGESGQSHHDDAFQKTIEFAGETGNLAR